eukprot:TRINITY_DN7489_c0_g1_i4.p1 TRINITY_DN7489_c0_g1~~TRINITY_DN7489_c0_g1_i4.p1  ORF type:complete len:189 (-),score=15.21 TRINITY_DN7489_c0_g1_i4:316-819(-)
MVLLSIPLMLLIAAAEWMVVPHMVEAWVTKYWGQVATRAHALSELTISRGATIGPYITRLAPYVPLAHLYMFYGRMLASVFHRWAGCLSYESVYFGVSLGVVYWCRLAALIARSIAWTFRNKYVPLYNIGRALSACIKLPFKIYCLILGMNLVFASLLGSTSIHHLF